MSYTLALDAMGGDQGIKPGLEAALICLAHYSQLHVQWIGPSQQLSAHLYKVPENQQHLLSRIHIVDAPEVINKSNDVSVALRHKTDSSMYMALQQLAEGKANACVSAGNSAALVALSNHLLNVSDKSQRPVFASYVPTIKGACLLLDMGANLSPSANQLLQYAILGQNLAQAMGAATKLKIGLLNITQVADRGIPVTQEAHKLLSAQVQLNYVGYIEPHQIFLGEVDILVCDGYAGNIIIKSCEGVSQYINQRIRQLIEPWQKTEPAQALMHGLHHDLNAKNFNGAFLLGAQKLVVKSHSRSDTQAMLAALQATIKYLDKQLNDNLTLPAHH